MSRRKVTIKTKSKNGTHEVRSVFADGVLIGTVSTTDGRDWNYDGSKYKDAKFPSAFRAGCKLEQVKSGRAGLSARLAALNGGLAVGS